MLFQVVEANGYKWVIEYGEHKSNVYLGGKKVFDFVSRVDLSLQEFCYMIPSPWNKMLFDEIPF